MNVRERYARERWVRLPGFLAPGTVRELERLTRDLPGRRASLSGREPPEWDELEAEACPELPRFFLGEPALAVVREALDLAVGIRPRVRCWANRYRIGDRIPPHRDGGGDVQMVVCLKAPAGEANGGVLHLATAGGVRACPLRPGDAVLLEVTAIEHWTTPLVATPAAPEPERMVLVGRYDL